MGMPDGQEDEGAGHRCRRPNPVGILGGDKDGVPRADRMVLTIGVNEPRTIDHVQDVIAGLLVEGKRTPRLHLDEICAEVAALQGMRRGAHASANTGQGDARFVDELDPLLALQHISDVILLAEAAPQRLEKRYLLLHRIDGTVTLCCCDRLHRKRTDRRRTRDAVLPGPARGRYIAPGMH